LTEKVLYISGVPRSGTSWIGQIFNSVPSIRYRFQPLFSHEFRGRIDEDSSEKEYQKFYEDLFNSDSEFLTQNDKVEKGLYPKFIKNNEDVLAFKESHFHSFVEPILRKMKNVSFVGVIRNPKATLYSWTRSTKEFPKGSDIFKEWRFAKCKNQGSEDYFGYYKWKEVANLYLDLIDKFGSRIQIIKYDDFIVNTEAKVENLFNLLKLPYSVQTDHFIKESIRGSDENYYSVYKGRANNFAWKANFPDYISEQIDEDLKATRLEQFLH